MKITKRNGNIVMYDDQKNIKSILKANAGVPTETISEKEAEAIVGQIFARLSESSGIITTQEIRSCTEEILTEKGYPLTAKSYMEYKKNKAK